MEKELVPELRFPEFSGEWEEKKLGEVTNKVERKNENLNLKPMMISANNSFIYQREKYEINKARGSLKNYTHIKKGELSYNRGASKNYPYGCTYVFLEEEGLVPSIYHSFSVKEGTEHYFGIYLKSDYSKKGLRKIVQSTARNDGMLNITYNNFMELKINVPSLQEQIKIAKFFTLIDKKIEKHEKKIARLEEYKRGMMQKIFPKRGESIPELRFKGFTDSWKQRKLGELVDISTGKLDANAMVEDGEYDFYTSGIKKYRIDTPAFVGPAITIAGNGATVGYMHLADDKFNAYQRTYVLEGFQADRQFLYSEISNRLPRKITEEARTGNIPYIVMDMLTNLNISLPVSEDEQVKIGVFIRQLDNLITLHQSKLEELKELKKGFMQKMFI